MKVQILLLVFFPIMIKLMQPLYCSYYEYASGEPRLSLEFVEVNIKLFRRRINSSHFVDRLNSLG